ncbi:MAG: hypothetical protein MJZ41_09615 [Bacteroidaceae bacterium]|nr:hypothetical protein [Bacteroidaceae bacterium]
MSLLYDLIEENFSEYRAYYEGIGLVLESGNGYFYFSRNETRINIENKLKQCMEWIDIVDFLKVYNSTFGPGFTFTKSNILEQFSNNVELQGKAKDLYTDKKKNEEKIDELVKDLERLNFVELENEIDGTYRVTMAFNYMEELINCLTIIENEEEI